VRTRRLPLSPPIASRSVRPLEEHERHYLRDVLRLEDGAPLVVFDGQGGEWTASLERDASGASVLAIGERRPDRGSDPTLPLVLVQALTHARSIDEVVARATEIGASAIVPVLAARGRVRLDAESAHRRRARWSTIAAGAARQCGRTRVPDCALPVPLPEALARLPHPGDGERRFLLTPDASRPFGESAVPPTRLVLMVGPEGGWTDEERILAARRGFEPRRLGPRTLRADTAGLAALAAAGVLWGDLDG
jgi:16S rRNA (uracil1498-N3)-methyltransferase